MSTHSLWLVAAPAAAESVVVEVVGRSSPFRVSQ